ncbi:uncharacterized protein BXZ73DRAFT_102730 [Epithele typhae]|uniref:uncharacterized protein n=1 Tax=Epithele typhae TaxID=378194 RepID=UPI0020082F26|nr:uncharacterized protein BXZ73DRAFT_102730 [Epithele typhae]KAH9927141.1 hypothetical protein BXZ73DRAFT_102730 [Epithele typhae]
MAESTDDSPHLWPAAPDCSQTRAQPHPADDFPFLTTDSASQAAPMETAKLDEEAAKWSDHELEAQIAFHTAQAARLKHLYNMRAAGVSKLPPEILSEVFLFQAAILREDRIALHCLEGSASLRHPFYRWLNVAHVCHHWRSVALRCSHLWTWVAFEERVHSDFIQTIIDRSRGLPLTVFLSANLSGTRCDACINLEVFQERANAAIDMTKTLLPRMRELYLFVEKEIGPEAIWDAFEGPAPLLETIHIEAIGISRYDLGDRRQAELGVPKAVFHGHVPKVRSLIVAGVQIRFSNPLFSANLRELAIMDCQCRSRLIDPPRFDRWLSTLRRMPHLEVLRIDRSIPTRDEEEDYHAVTLPNLKTLHITAHADVFIDHMHYLRFPRSTAVYFHSIDTWTYLYAPDQIERFQIAVASLFKHMIVQAVAYGTVPLNDHDALDADDHSACQVWAVRSPKHGADAVPTPPTAPVAPDAPAPPRLTFGSGQRSRGNTTVAHALDALDLSRVHAVHIADDRCGMKWARILGRATAVTSLRVDGQAAFGVPALLAGGVPRPLEFAEDSVTDEEDCELEPEPEPVAEEGKEDSGAVASTGAEKEGKEREEDAARPLVPLFPHLRRLHFVAVDMQFDDLQRAPWHCHGSVVDFAPYETRGVKYGFSVLALMRSLRARREQGATDVGEVKFERCCSEDLGRDIAPLAEVVPEVLWDGYLETRLFTRTRAGAEGAGVEGGVSV